MALFLVSAAGILSDEITPKKFLYLSPVDLSAGDLFFYLNAAPCVTSKEEARGFFSRK